MHIDIANNIEVKGMRAGQLPISNRVRGLIGLDARGAPIPPAERATGTDLSHWNGLMNHATMKAAGAKFSYFKATQGTTYFDDQYTNNSGNCQVPFGAYHFLTTSVPGINQANWFCDKVVNNRGVFVPVVDVELSSVDSALIKAYCTQILVRLGELPMIYTSAYFWALVTGSDKAWISANCKLWVAHWGTDSPILPTGWTTYAVHQYSADGNGKGAMYGAPPTGDPDMDLNYCRTSMLPPSSWELEIDAWARTKGYTGIHP